MAFKSHHCDVSLSKTEIRRSWEKTLSHRFCFHLAHLEATNVTDGRIYEGRCGRRMSKIYKRNLEVVLNYGNVFVLVREFFKDFTEHCFFSQYFVKQMQKHASLRLGWQKLWVWDLGRCKCGCPLGHFPAFWLSCIALHQGASFPQPALPLKIWIINRPW